MPNIAQSCHTICRKRRNGDRRAAAQVGAAHIGAVQLRYALHKRDTSLHLDIRTHARKLRDMLIAAFKDIFNKNTGSVGQAGCRHQRRLRISREARIGHRAHRTKRMQTLWRA